MAEIVNLQREKKRRARAEAAQAAAENRVRFGRDKAQKMADSRAVEREKARHGQALLEPKAPEKS